MSLHQCPLPSHPSRRLPPQQPNLGPGINPGAIAPKPNREIAHWNRSALALGPLLLLWPLVTGCTIEPITSPSENQAIPAQAAEQAKTVSDDRSSPKARALGDAPAELPQPSQAIPQLMSEASSTANNELFPPAEPGSHQGPLRVGNQTEHPLRIAFLAQGEGPPKTDSVAAEPMAGERPDWDSPTADGTAPEPFHWDFAPAEGGSDGLLLALPEGDLALRGGDVIVAFAQDGSQRYWGPYVVGQTSLPYWNGDRNEWQLLVQP